MFSTKIDVVNWINDFAGGLQLEPIKEGKFWRIYDADGFRLSEEQIAKIEALKA